MIAVPRWMALGPVLVSAAFTLVFGTFVLVTRPHPMGTAAGLALFAAALLVYGYSLWRPRRSWRRAGAVTAVGLLIPTIGSVALEPADSFSNCAWYVAGVLCILFQLMLHRRRALGALVLGALVAQTLVWSGPSGLVRFGILAMVLMVGVVAVSAWAISVTVAEIRRCSDAERQALTWRAAQDAYQSERQVRLANTALVAAPMLRRIVEADGPLSEADRAECRLLEQTIRDEIRGRRLLNRAVREQVMALRRRGAAVQVHDDGGLDDLDPDALDGLLTQLAGAITGLTSDRVVIRSAPADSAQAISVVAMTIDPVAAALGAGDDEDQVDLWLELARPVPA